MSDYLFEYTGVFQIWSYWPSHQRLLLRGAKSEERTTQVDILFVGVTHVRLPVAFRDVSIRQADGAELSEPAGLGMFADSDRLTYRIVGQNVDGCIMAESVHVDESDREYYDPSPLKALFGFADASGE